MKETILGLRWFWLNIQYFAVCTSIFILKRLASFLLRFQVRMVRWSGLVFFSVILSLSQVGCAPTAHRTALTPSPVGVIRAVTGAQTAAAKLAPHVAPEGKPALASLDEALRLAQTEVANFTTLVEAESVKRQEAETAAAYWQGKQSKALKELWFWRGAAALILGSIAGWFALRSGLKLAL